MGQRKAKEIGKSIIKISWKSLSPRLDIVKVSLDKTRMCPGKKERRLIDENKTLYTYEESTLMTWRAG